MDRDLLEGICDPDELKNEERIMQHGEHPFFDVADVADDPRSGGPCVDFRDQIDMGHCDCVCNGDCVCVPCCTLRDLDMVPARSKGVALLNHRTRLIFNHIEEVFDLIMPLNLALRLGFVGGQVGQ